MTELWSLSLGGSPALTTSPQMVPETPRAGHHAAVYDTAGARIVIFGGQAELPSGGSSRRNDMWGLDVTGSPTWTRLASDSPSTLSGHKAFHDANRDRMVVLTGDVRLWELALEGRIWKQLATAGSGPPNAYEVVHDPMRDRLIVLGENGASYIRTLSLAGTPTWSTVPTAGGPPTATSARSAIYDPARDRIVVFGGLGPLGYNNEVWALTLADPVPIWSPIPVIGPAPRSRGGARLIYDPLRDRIVIYSGNYESTRFDPGVLGDTWALNLSGVPAWTQLPNGPVPRSGASAIYDAARDRMVIFGGNHATCSPSCPPSYPMALDDIWALYLDGSNGWLELGPPGPKPSKRYSHAAIYDPSRDAMILTGGYDYWSLSGQFDDYLLQWEAFPTPVPLWLVQARAFGGEVRLEWSIGAARAATISRKSPAGGWSKRASLTPDAAGRVRYVDRDVLAGARYGYRIEVASDEGTRVSDETWIDVPRVSKLQLEGLQPNPARGDLMVAFTLPDARSAKIELVGIDGRRVIQQMSPAGAGRHVVRLASTGAVPPGIYFVTLERAGERLVRRCSVIR